jgi:hypothetical protein
VSSVRTGLTLLVVEFEIKLFLFQKLEIDFNGNGNLYTCEVLDCDTINQVKSKCLYQIYKNKPASEMPSTDEVDLGMYIQSLPSDGVYFLSYCN